MFLSDLKVYYMILKSSSMTLSRFGTSNFSRTLSPRTAVFWSLKYFWIFQLRFLQAKLTYLLSLFPFPSHPKRLKRSFTLVTSKIFRNQPSLHICFSTFHPSFTPETETSKISRTRHSNWKLTTTGPPTFTFPFTFLWLGLGFQQAKGAKWSRSGLIGLGCSWLWTIGWCTSRRESVKQKPFEKWKGKVEDFSKKFTPESFF